MAKVYVAYSQDDFETYATTRILAVATTREQAEKIINEDREAVFAEWNEPEAEQDDGSFDNGKYYCDWHIEEQELK